MRCRQRRQRRPLSSISNPGPGIPQQYVGRIFDRFWQADPSRGRSSQGAGLGLSIVKTIMELHSGKVSVVSDSGETTFTLIFAGPVTRTDTPTAAPGSTGKRGIAPVSSVG